MKPLRPPDQEERERLLAGRWQQVARDVVDDLELVLDEPPLPLTPTSLARFPKLDAPWYGAQTTELEALGFRPLGDVDGTPLTARNAWPTLVRVFLSPDGRSSAALFHVRPKAPGLFTWLLLKLLGKWPAAQKVAEFMSYGPAGALVTTTAEGPFQVPPGSRRNLAPKETGLAELWASHQRALAGFGEVRAARTLEDLGSAREEHRLRLRAWRQQVGLLDAELDALLAPSGAEGQAVRPHVLAELRRRGLAARR